MVITVKSLVGGCDTNAQGAIVFQAILDGIARNGSVTVSFSGVLNVTSSFVNSAFVDLLAHLSFDQIKQVVRISGASPQVADMIKSRLTFEASRIQRAA